MAKDALVQVRMDAEIKEEVESLYRGLGTSFAEAVRVFAVQSIKAQGMPFRIAEPSSTAGRLSKYANADLTHLESKAFEKTMADKHACVD